MLALSTGWTPDVMSELPRRFRAACHWALFARAIVGPEGMPSVPASDPSMTPEQRLARAKATASLTKARLSLFPED